MDEGARANSRSRNLHIKVELMKKVRWGRGWWEVGL